MKSTLNIENMLDPDFEAREIAKYWVQWDQFRSVWKEEKKELRNYLYATDTRKTTDSSYSWFNSTTTPKLTQVFDNLKANYSAALFPQEKWHKWEAEDREAATKAKRDTIQAYMDNKIRQSKFRTTADKLVDDYVQYGNCFATVEFVRDFHEVDGEYIAGYIGPRVVRISPYDIVFNPASSSFSESPKIVRSLVSLGDLAKEDRYEEVLGKVKYNRRQVAAADTTDKGEGYVADGFSNITQYYGSGYVEILTFYGDLFNNDTGELKTGRKIEIVDKAYILSDEPIASWLGNEPILHAGWRNRPDNLWSMGPLDNLVGLQYRIDHLENLKADVFDMIALPMLKVRGDVEAFEVAPGQRIYVGEEGDVSPIQWDSTALNADLQIQMIENRMEELAGAPRQAMGIRTPGEKTAFEVDTLQNSASRIFQHKAEKFEQELLEPLLNAMLESARRNMDTSDLVRVLDDQTGAALFKSITKEDITAKGKIVPVGARHFAEKARRMQNLIQLNQLKADPSVGVHLSGKEVARILAEELNEPSLFQENVGVDEQLETEMAANDAQAEMQEDLAVAAEVGV